MGVYGFGKSLDEKEREALAFHRRSTRQAAAPPRTVAAPQPGERPREDRSPTRIAPPGSGLPR
jgi:hypothetical protein